MIAGEGEKEVRKLTFAELRDRVAMYAAALKAVGVQKGDCVVGTYVEAQVGKVKHQLIQL